MTAKRGAVACDVEECSQAGVAMLKAGGNAVDAVIGRSSSFPVFCPALVVYGQHADGELAAASICMGSIGMFASGVGGGGFLVTRMANGTSASFNFREEAPAAASRHMFDHDGELARQGGLAVGVPGEVHGFATAHRAFGGVPWSALWAPSVAFNRHGFRITPILARIMHEDEEYFTAHRDEWIFLFNPDTGVLLKEGDTIVRANYADTLETIAGVAPGMDNSKDPYIGVHEFYNGSLAEQLTEVVQAAGGIITPADFAAYTTEHTPTLSTFAFGREVLTCTPPCSGAVMLEGLNIASQLPMSSPASAVSQHYLVETMKWLSAGRTELGDPTDPVVRRNSARFNELLSQEWAAAAAANTSADKTYGYEHYHPSYEPTEPAGTSHISALDGDGNAAALTTSLNLYWGAHIIDNRTGVILNSEMDDFSIPGKRNSFLLRPSIYNYIAPRKRPLSSMAPSILVDAATGKVDFVIGGSGGSRIVTGVFEAIVKKCLWRYSLLDTIRSPRLHHQLLPEMVYAEYKVDDKVVRALEARGHVVEKRGKNQAVGQSVLQGVARTEDGLGVEALADWWRKGGKAAGY